MKISELRGAYTADRAAALAGVPLSTVHYWARNEILIPSVSPTKVKMWSYTDLMGLRTIYWLRQRKVHNRRVAGASDDDACGASSVGPSARTRS
jgi:DNA-binding transcriptional MerR regulator